MELIKELEAFIEKETVNTEEESFEIKTLDEANEIVRRVKYFEKEISENNLFAEKELEKYQKIIEDFKNKKNKYPEERLSHYKLLLEEYAKKELKGKKTKTIVFPYGKVSFKKQQPKFDYNDKEIISFLKENDLKDLIKTEVKESLNKTNLKKAVSLSDDGSAFIGDKKVSGLTVTKQEDKMTIL